MLVVLAGCSSSAPCAPQRLPDCETCGPGEVRHGLQFSDLQSLASVAVFDDGSIACLACADVLYRDAHGGARTTLDLGNARAGFYVVTRGIAAGDALYAVREETEQDEPEPITYDHFLALDEAGHIRWKIDPLPAGVRLVAAGAAGPFLDDTTTLTAYAAADGSVRWTAPHPDRVAADATGGAFVVVASASQFPPAAMFEALDASGTSRWTKTFTASGGTTNLPAGVLVDTIAASPDGGLLVTAGFIGSSLDLGEITLPGGPDGVEIVAALAPDGTTLWAHALPPELMGPRVVALGDAALVFDALAGDGSALGLPSADATDSVLAIYDASGLVHADLIGGPGQQLVFGVAPTPDGTVWLDVNGETITIGSQTYDTSGGIGGTGYVAVDVEP